MVFSFACAADVGNALVAFGHAIARGLGLVVVFLLIHNVYDVSVCLLKGIWQRVAVAYYGLWLSACLYVFHACAIAAYEVGGMVEYAEWGRV